MLIYGFQPFMNMFVLSEASVFDDDVPSDLFFKVLNSAKIEYLYFGKES